MPGVAVESSPVSEHLEVPPEVENSAERVAGELRRAILRGELLPGVHVRQTDWAARLGVSRSVLREAFKTLTNQRLLRHQAQSGYFIARLSPSEMEELYQLRMLVEGQLLSDIQWPDADGLADLEARFNAFMTALRSGQIATAIDRHRDFAFALYDLSPKTLTAGEAKRLWEMSAAYRAVVLTAMVMRDPELNEAASVGAEQLASLALHDSKRLIQANRRERLDNLENFASTTGMLSHLISTH